jgi:nicotinate-nucleotide adenylyltransferase
VALTRWRDWREIVRMAVICVAGRPNAGVHSGDATPPGVPPEADLRLLQLPSMDESATEVRERVAHGDGIDHLVPAGVASYIERHQLYRTA